MISSYEVIKLFLIVSVSRTLVATARSMELGEVVYSTIAGDAVSKFCMMLFVSALIGVAFGLLSALVNYDNLLLIGPTALFLYYVEESSWQFLLLTSKKVTSNTCTL